MPSVPAECVLSLEGWGAPTGPSLSESMESLWIRERGHNSSMLYSSTARPVYRAHTDNDEWPSDSELQVTTVIHRRLTQIQKHHSIAK